MKCASCGTILEEYRNENLVIDICPSCNGMWFDRDEMQTFVDFLLRENNIPDAKIDAEKKAATVYKLDETIKACPRCGKNMQKYNYAYDSNVFLDKCVSCGGIWTDGKEIYQIATHVKGNPALEAMGHAIASERGADAGDSMRNAFDILNIIGRILFTPKRRHRNRWF